MLCVGIDPRPPFPDECHRGLRDDRSGLARAIRALRLGLVEAVAPHAAAVKPQVAFFEALGGYGLTALERVCAAAAERGVPVIADAKRGDIPSTAAAYAAAWLEARPGDEAPLADALTVNPYLGGDRSIRSRRLAIGPAGESTCSCVRRTPDRPTCRPSRPRTELSGRRLCPLVAVSDGPRRQLRAVRRWAQ